MVPFALIAAGTALQIYGQYRANIDQAQQEVQNAAFYEKQANFVREAQIRQADIAAKNYEYTRGAQISASAKGGVDISGSARANIVETMASKVEELNAIKRKGELDYSLAKARARQSQSMADRLGSLEYNALQVGGTALTNYAGYLNAKGSA